MRCHISVFHRERQTAWFKFSNKRVFFCLKRTNNTGTTTHLASDELNHLADSHTRRKTVRIHDDIRNHATVAERHIASICNHSNNAFLTVTWRKFVAQFCCRKVFSKVFSLSNDLLLVWFNFKFAFSLSWCNERDRHTRSSSATQQHFDEPMIILVRRDQNLCTKSVARAWEYWTFECS